MKRGQSHVCERSYKAGGFSSDYAALCLARGSECGRGMAKDTCSIGVADPVALRHPNELQRNCRNAIQEKDEKHANEVQDRCLKTGEEFTQTSENCLWTQDGCHN
jgi:hypothetical protein